jgi:hypothetical protein
VKTLTVQELMVPLSEYTTVSEEATLYDAVCGPGLGSGSRSF